MKQRLKWRGLKNGEAAALKSSEDDVPMLVVDTMSLVAAIDGWVEKEVLGSDYSEETRVKCEALQAT